MIYCEIWAMRIVKIYWLIDSINLPYINIAAGCINNYTNFPVFFFVNKTRGICCHIFHFITRKNKCILHFGAGDSEVCFQLQVEKNSVNRDHVITVQTLQAPVSQTVIYEWKTIDQFCWARQRKVWIVASKLNRVCIQKCVTHNILSCNAIVDCMLKVLSLMWWWIVTIILDPSSCEFLEALKQTHKVRPK